MAMVLATSIMIQGTLHAQDKTSTFNWYGYFKLDMALDNSPSSHGNFVMFVKPRVKDANTRTMSITARQTRVGLDIERGTSSGKLEFDFYGGGQENKNLLMLRKAYVEVPLGPINLLAGQASDIISPLVPSTVNYTVGWGAGNIGYRRPQIRLGVKNARSSASISVGRNISGDLNGDSVVDGEASCVPVLQTRISHALGGATRLTIGASGHFGLMNAPDAIQDEYHTWSINGDVNLKLSSRVRMLGEIYSGANTGAYFGAILNGDCATDLRSAGGWANIQIKASDRISYSLGGGIDDLRNENSTTLIDIADTRNRNVFYFGNMWYQLSSDVRMGLEVSTWTTTYTNVSPGFDLDPTDVRLQWSIQSSF